MRACCSRYDAHVPRRNSTEFYAGRRRKVIETGNTSNPTVQQLRNCTLHNRPFIKLIRFTYTMVAYLTIRSRGRDRQLVAAKKMKDKTRERDGVVDEEKTTTTFLCLKSESCRLWGFEGSGGEARQDAGQVALRWVQKTEIRMHLWSTHERPSTTYQSCNACELIFLTRFVF